MPELSVCPSCGTKVQVLDLSRTIRTRCFSCGTVFTPGEVPPEQESDGYGVRDEAEDAPPDTKRGRGRQRRPLCPGCHRPVRWEDRDCSHCGYQFDPANAARDLAWNRRDSLPHRARTVESLGTVALWAGASALFTGPVGMAVALSTGIPAAWMAVHDVPRMQTGEIDPSGRFRTELGGNMARVGIVLGLLLGSCFIVYAIIRWM